MSRAHTWWLAIVPIVLMGGFPPLASTGAGAASLPSPQTSDPLAATAPAAPEVTPHKFLSPSADLLVNGTGDADGYHISVADAQSPSVWLPLATLDPPLGSASSA
jgi:hypothetical protein